MLRKSTEIVNKIIEYVDDCYFKDASCPSVREIASKVGISKSSVSNYLQYMKENNLINSYDGWRNIQTKKVSKSISGNLVPIIGEISCGLPLLAEENIETYVSIPKELFKNGNYFILRAHGDSMVKAGINDKDLVIVRKTNTAENGNIIVALIDDECTLKRYYKDNKNKKIRLHPENDSMKDQIYDNIKIQGIAVNVIKSIQ